MIAHLPFVSIKPNYFTTYIKTEQSKDHSSHAREWAPLPTDTQHHGIMSDKANKRVRLAIDWLINIAKEKTLSKNGVQTNFKYKLNFITLTLSSKQHHSDNEIKNKLLNQFLTELRTKHKCENYLWRAESQRNGNIHFHICTDVFIAWRKLRTDWNRIQQKLDYIQDYKIKTGKEDPNSTDVHSIVKVKNLSAYLSKYCSKNSKGYVVMVSKASATPFKPSSFLTYKHPIINKKANFYRQIYGRLWGMSSNLSKLKSASQEISGVLEQEIEWLKNKKKSKVKYFDRATIFLFSTAELIKLKCFELALCFENYKERTLSCIKEAPKIKEEIKRYYKPIEFIPQQTLVF